MSYDSEADNQRLLASLLMRHYSNQAVEVIKVWLNQHQRRKASISKRSSKTFSRTSLPSSSEPV